MVPRDLLAYIRLEEEYGDVVMIDRSTDEPQPNRRAFLSAAAVTLAALRLRLAGIPTSPKASAGSGQAVRVPQPALTSFGPIKQIDAGLLNVGYAQDGPADGPAVILLHGWPYDIHSYVDVAPLLAAKGYRVIVPYSRGYGTTRFLASDTVRNAQQSAVALDVIAVMDALAIKRAIVAGFDWGARTAAVVAALWPERCKALVAVSGYLITNPKANLQPLPPKAELGWWYQYYFATDRGRLGYAANRREFNRLIWKSASPKWAFDDATFDRTAASFDNPDHVDIVIHNYRWRLDLAPGEARYDGYEQKLFAAPAISVPTITVASDFDGAAADGKAYARKFTGKYAHCVLDGIGHNVPQEAPKEFAQAIIDADHSVMHMRRSLLATILLGATALLSSAVRSPAMQLTTPSPIPLPDGGALPSLAGATLWLNSQPLTPASLRGKVVLVDFSTYTCINWLRTLPHIRAWAEHYKDRGLVVINVQTPEFEFEKSLDNVRRASKEMGVVYPTAVDNDYAIWNAFDNHYWPALYVVDAKGAFVHHQFGEGDYERLEAIIKQLLAEAGQKSIGAEVAPIHENGAEVGAQWSTLKTGETYVGSDRGENFSSPGGLAPGKSHVYAAPAQLILNHWALAGDWTVGKQGTVSHAANARIVFRFHARDLHLVMGPAKSGSSVRFRVRSTDSRPAPHTASTSTPRATAPSPRSDSISSCDSPIRSSIDNSRSSSSIRVRKHSSSPSAERHPRPHTASGAERHVQSRSPSLHWCCRDNRCRRPSEPSGHSQEVGSHDRILH